MVGTALRIAPRSLRLGGSPLDGALCRGTLPRSRSTPARRSYEAIKAFCALRVCVCAIAKIH
jgi:hypothetical protein